MIYNIKDFGAINDGITLNTSVIQAAIDKAAQHGGTVLIEDGIYKTGSIKMRSNVNLHIEAGATLLGSENTDDYDRFEDLDYCDYTLAPLTSNSCLILIGNCENASITGMGKIDCNGEHFVVPVENGKELPCAYRRIDGFTPPRVIFCVCSKNIKIEDISMVNQPAGWSYWIHDCEFVNITGIKINADLSYPNNDGIHINCSRFVNVSNCNIVCSDDCLVLRANSVTLKENKPCEQITITNCNLTSYSGSVRIGWVNDGVIRNITLSNLSIKNSATGVSLLIPLSIRSDKVTDVGREETVIENINFSNIVMEQVAGYPIYISLADHEEINIKSIKNLRFSNITVTSVQFPFIYGTRKIKVKDIYFDGCFFKRISNKFCKDRPCRGYTMAPKHSYDPQPITIKNAENIVFNNSSFSSED